MKEIEELYKLKLLNEKELKEHTQTYAIWLFYYFVTHSFNAWTLFGCFIALFPFFQIRGVTNKFIIVILLYETYG